MATIRRATAADARGIAAVHVASWRTTYHDIMPESYLTSLSAEDRERMWCEATSQADPGRPIYVAEDEAGRIVGFAAGGPQREGDPAYAGELYAIYLLAEALGGGLGRRLVRAVAAELARAGITSMLVWVLQDNPACRFYEALGGVLLPERQTHERAGVRLVEVCYGWPGTGPLLAPKP